MASPDFLANVSVPFSVSVNKRPQNDQAEGVCLEIELTNQSTETVKGHLWLADKHGRKGPPEAFSLHPCSLSVPEVKAGNVFPYLPLNQGSLWHVAVRIQQAGSGEAFWQGDLILHREQNGRITVDVDKSVRANTYLGGIDNGVINVYAGHDSGSWHDVRLRLRGPKDLADPSDAQRPHFRGRHRIQKIRPEFPVHPAVETARLTLAHRLDSGREVYVQLIAGETLNLGRARTWDPKTSIDETPNDIVLRTHKDDEADDYVSRFHGRIRLTAEGVVYENLSDENLTGAGTQIGNRQLSHRGESSLLSHNSLIKPGQSAAYHPSRSLGLQVCRTVCQITPESYNLLVRDSHLNSGIEADLRHEVITLQRNDRLSELERYIFFRHAARLGASTHCGWQIPHPSVQDVHATVLWFDESFWIEPVENCSVKVNGTGVSANRVRRLIPDSTLEIGDVRFLVLPEWKQHIIDCDCCTGHV